MAIAKRFSQIYLLVSLPKKSDDFILYSILIGKGSANSTKHKEKDIKKDDCYILMPQSPHKFKRVLLSTRVILVNYE
jgi:hypothetical protein